MSTRRKIYGIDLDGVCFDFGSAFLSFLRAHFPHLSIPKDIELTSYYWYEIIPGLDKDTFWEAFDDFGRGRGYFDLELIEGALEGLRAIEESGHSIVYITNRPMYARQDTVEALAKHNFPSAEHLWFATGHKAPFIRDLAVDVFIDDSPHTISEICDTCPKTYCFDYPFNQNIEAPSDSYTRVSSWADFLEKEGILCTK